MYKRHKRSFNGIIVGKTACASAGNRENIVDESSETGCPETNRNSSQSLTTTKEPTQVPRSVSIPPVLKEPVSNENLVEIFSSCGMDIENDPSHTLSQ